MLRTKVLLVALAALLAVFGGSIGCGTDSTTGNDIGNGLVIGGTGIMSGVVPEVGIFATKVVRGTETETSFHVEAINVESLESDLIVYVKYDNGESGEFVIIREGDYQSEAFEFQIEGKDVTSVAIAPHAERLSVQLPKLVKMNVGGQRIEVTENYIFQHNTYAVDPENASASK